MVISYLESIAHAKPAIRALVPQGSRVKQKRTETDTGTGKHTARHTSMVREKDKNTQTHPVRHKNIDTKCRVRTQAR